MCGIFGAVFLPADLELDVDAALGSLHHRGPDDRGAFRAPGIVLGHTRLSILDLSAAGHQPMTSDAADVILVFNGEIYNHHALRDELEAKGHRFRSRTDSEVILEGYRAWGDRVVDKLDGMFAFAIFDRAEHRLLLARDRSGKKPLFYGFHRGALYFASEMKALGAAGFPIEPDMRALPNLLVLGYVPAPRTLLAGIFQLPPAHTLALTRGGSPRITPYWRAPFDAAPLRMSESEHREHTRQLVTDAVRKRLEADVPLGAFLSGGIDSTIIVGVMAKLLGRKVRTFSIGFVGDPRYDETRYARLAARAFGTEHTEFRIEPQSIQEIDRLVWMHDGPFGDSSAIPTSIVSMLARQHVTVALSGDGGDELFCGYTRFLAAEAAERIPTPILRLARTFAERVPGGSSDRDLSARAKRFLRVASRPLPERMIQWISIFGNDVDSAIRPELRLDLEEPFAWSRALFERPGTPIARILSHNFESYLPYDLLVKADRSSMMHSLELRSPFLDTDLIEYAARIPDHLKRRGTDTKRILKAAFADILPIEIQKRGKMGFGAPLGVWFRGELRDFVSDNLGRGALCHQWLNPAYVGQILAEHFESRVDHTHRLWLMLTLERWLRLLPSMRSATGPFESKREPAARLPT